MTNLAALEVELRALLKEVREQPEADPDKLLRVFTEISVVRGQIEQIQGQLDYLSDAVDLATLTICPSDTCRSAHRGGDVGTGRHRPGCTAQPGDGLQTLADWGITFAIYTLPMSCCSAWTGSDPLHRLSAVEEATPAGASRRGAERDLIKSGQGW